MFDHIIQNQELFSLVRQSCFENGVGASIDDALLINGDLHHEKIIVLKLDAYYSSANMHNPPPSPDYLVIVKCEDDDYDCYIIELRNTVDTRAARPAVITEKFRTAVDDFLAVKFRHIFFDANQIRFKKMRLFLVTDPLNLKGKALSPDDYRKKIEGTVLDAYGTLMPFRVGQHVCMIEPILPDPMIEPC